MSDPLQIACPNCSKSYHISNESFGKVVRCRSCQLSFKIDPENFSMMVAPKPSSTEINAVPPPLPSVKPKANKTITYIALAVLLLTVVGGGFWLIPKSASQQMAGENGIVKPIITEFQQDVSEARRKLAIVRNKQKAGQRRSDKFKNAADKIEKGFGDPKLKAIAVMWALTESTSELLSGVKLESNDIYKLRMSVVSAFGRSQFQLTTLQGNNKISKQTFESAMVELENIDSQWKSAVEASK